MLRVVVVLLLAVALVLGLAWALQRRLIYLPDARPVPPATQVLGPDAREISLRTDDGLTLGAWLVAPTGPDRRMHVLVAPGNAGNRADRVLLARRLAAAGFTVMLFDYRGYAGNPGSPSESGLRSDARAALSSLLENGAQPDRLIYFGESLGAAVLTGLATERPPAGLVLRSPFTDLAAVGSQHYPMLPVRALLRDRFPVREQIAAVRVPTSVVYGERDRIVPPAQSQAVAAAATDLVRLLPVSDADHNDLDLAAGKSLVNAVVEVADRLG